MGSSVGHPDRVLQERSRKRLQPGQLAPADLRDIPRSILPFLRLRVPIGLLGPVEPGKRDYCRRTPKGPFGLPPACLATAGRLATMGSGLLHRFATGRTPREPPD
jgi:hypothetical protein